MQGGDIIDFPEELKKFEKKKFTVTLILSRENLVDKTIVYNAVELREGFETFDESANNKEELSFEFNETPVS